MKTQEQDNQLLKIAKLRAGFKGHFVAYVLANAAMIGVWYFTDKKRYKYFWPKWVLLGWGTGIISHYVKAYSAEDLFSAQKEYEKLISNQIKN